MPLEKWIRKGLLQIPAQGPTTTGLENHLATMCKTIEDYRPSVFVVDPFTNLISVGTAISVKSMLTRLIDLLKTHQVTAMFTNLSLSGEEITAPKFRRSWTRGYRSTKSRRTARGRGFSMF